MEIVDTNFGKERCLYVNSDESISESAGNLLEEFDDRAYALKEGVKIAKDCLVDCEKFMAIMNSKTIKDNAVNSKVKVGVGKWKPFGATDEANIAVANEAIEPVTNNNVMPGIGEGFIIVNLDWLSGIGEYPYHAACVVAKNNNYFATIETFDGQDGYCFKKYRQKHSKDGKTFHEYWSDQACFDGMNTKTLHLRLL